MHNQFKISIATITCISIAACNTTQTTETNTDDANPDSVPMAKLVAPTPLPELETPNSEPSPLAIGDNAPAISIDHWVKGEEFDSVLLMAKSTLWNFGQLGVAHVLLQCHT